jgi:hypothetical protein
MGHNGSGPPDHFTFLQTENDSPTETAAKLSDLWNQGFTGPFVVVGTVIFVAGYKK